MYPEKGEFIKQVKMHHDIVKGLLGYDAKVFENTELLYNNAIAKTVDSLGYKGIYTEGIGRFWVTNLPTTFTPPKTAKTSASYFATTN